MNQGIIPQLQKEAERIVYSPSFSLEFIREAFTELFYNRVHPKTIRIGTNKKGYRFLKQQIKTISMINRLNKLYVTSKRNHKRSY